MQVISQGDYLRIEDTILLFSSLDLLQLLHDKVESHKWLPKIFYAFRLRSRPFTDFMSPISHLFIGGLFLVIDSSLEIDHLINKVSNFGLVSRNRIHQLFSIFNDRKLNFVVPMKTGFLGVDAAPICWQNSLKKYASLKTENNKGQQ